VRSPGPRGAGRQAVPPDAHLPLHDPVPGPEPDLTVPPGIFANDILPAVKRDPAISPSAGSGRRRKG
jgi:hypothetical protein